MATYKQIQDYVRNNYGYNPKTCWIAHMKEVCGLPVRQAPNRWNPTSRQIPCPQDKQSDIRQAFEHFHML
ncbi:MAG: hypothetical protein HDT20_07810 [Oscillibacter sp.]|nr:hypothetical protein [Oscillibacter sp.]MBD5170002.1 hypothetical protein [Oscillibacter sp.]